MPELTPSGGDPTVTNTQPVFVPVQVGNLPQAAVSAKTYTADEYQAMATNQYLTGIAHVAAKLGVELDEDNSPKKRIAQIVDAVGTKVTTAETAIKEMTDGEAKTARAALERELSALKAGVPGDKVERVVKYAVAGMDDNTDFDAALKVAMQDLNLTAGADSAKESTTSKKPIVVAGQSTEPPPAKKWKEMNGREQTEYFRKDREGAIALAQVDGIKLVED